MLEQLVVSFVVDFLSDKATMEIIADDVLAYYNKRTDEGNLKSINAKIAAIQADVERLTDAYVTAKSVLLQNSIEKKMADYEVLLNDLYTQKIKLETERGYKLTKQDILEFVEGVLESGEPDFEFQKRVIDILVSKVIVYDGHTIVLFNIRGGKNIVTEDVSVEDVQNAVGDISNGVQSPTPTLHHKKPSRTFTIRLGFCLPLSARRFGYSRCTCIYKHYYRAKE